MINIDVLMSTYNDEEYLSLSIESILNQSYKFFNFLIIDDCSTDSTLNIIKGYQKKDNRIKLIENSVNRGLSYNLNKGVNLSTADYIVRMDADDISHPNRISVLVSEILEFPEIDVLGSFAIEIDENSEEKGIIKVPIKDYDIHRLLWTCPFVHPSVIFRRESILNVGNYEKNLRRRQDYELWFRCGERKMVFRNLDFPLLSYRIESKMYYSKNNLKVNISQLKIGIRGSWNNSLGISSYLGISLNFLSQLLPTGLKWKLRELKGKYLSRMVE